MALSKKKINSLVFLPLYFLFLSTIVIQIRDYSEIAESPVTLGTIHKILFTNMSFFLIFSYVFVKRLKLIFPTPMIIYAGYIVLGVLSLIKANLLGYSLWKLFEVITAYLLGLYIISISLRKPYIALIFYENIIKIILLFVFSAIFGIFINPGLAFKPPTVGGSALLNYQLEGYILNINPNSLGLLSGILLIISICRLNLVNFKEKQRFFWRVIGITSLIVVILAQSRTSWVAIGVAIFVLIIFSEMKLYRKILFSVAILLIFVVAPDILLNYFQRGANPEHIRRLGGRMYYWEAAMESIKENKFIGIGFADGSRYILSNIEAGEASTLHSDYMDAAVSCGIGGVLLLISAYFSAVYLIIKRRKNMENLYGSEYSMEFLLILLMIFIRSITGTSIASFSYFLIIFVVIIACAFVAHSRHFINQHNVTPIKRF